jgi:NADH-quinone oxidoreductase subunit G
MPDVNVTIDGVRIAVPAGTNVVDAARMVQTAIPVFCYHPRLKPAGMCRMCLVQIGTPKVDPATRQPVIDDNGQPVIAMMPKLQTGCTTPVSEGMVVKTVTEEVAAAQKGVLEFLLTSHPLDCPVCDKGGECPLQNLTMQWGPGKSRFDYNDKVHFEKPVKLGDLIYLDRERCILCSRCVRFQDEIADDPVLGFDMRGRNWQIISKSDPGFDSKFSGNTTDICPVGALTSADFRFKARVWELESKPAVCTLCSLGCNLSLDMRHDELMRVMPRENAAVNDIWICDKGRFGHRFVGSAERLTTPLIRRDGNLQPASWEEALQLVAEKFAAVLSGSGPQALGGIAAPRLSNEDLYTFQKLFRHFGSDNLDHRVGAPSEPAPTDVVADVGVGVGSDLNALGAGTAVIVVGADPEEEAPVYMLRLRAIAQRGGSLVVANFRPTKLDRSANIRLRYGLNRDLAFARALLRAVHEQVAFQNLNARTPGLDELRKLVMELKLEELAVSCGVGAEQIRDVAKRYLEAENAIIVYGHDAQSAGPQLAEALAATALLAGKVGKANNGLIALTAGGNARGALDMGLRPRSGGLGAAQMWQAALDGSLKALYIAGLDPVASLPQARAAIEKADFIVVQELFLTATAQLADVVLPAASVAERDGTYTNAERRVQRSRQARHAVGESRADWQIVQGIAQRLEAMVIQPAAAPTTRQAKKGGATVTTQVATAAKTRWDYLVPGEVAAEIAASVPAYSSITYNTLAATGTSGNWGRQMNEAVYYDGTSYENSEGVGIQYPSAVERGQVRVQISADTPTQPDSERSFTLLTMPLAYSADPLLRDSKLQAHILTATAAIAASDATSLGIKPGETLRIHSAAGSVELPARVLSDMPTGCVIVASGVADEGLAAVQTGPRTAVRVEKA